MRENRTSGLSGGRGPALRRAPSDPTVRTPGNAGRAKGLCQGHVFAKRKKVHLELAPIMALPSIFLRRRLSRLAKPRRSRCMPFGEATLGKPDAGNPHVRFEEGGGGRGHDS